MNREKEIKRVEKYGKYAQGKKEYIKFLNNEKVSRKDVILSKCYSCAGFYEDIERDCGITTCPLYPYHPYANERYKKLRKTRGKGNAEALRRYRNEQRA